MQKLKVVFMGTPEFAVAGLNAIQNSQHQLVGVITAPDKPAGRGKKLQHSAVKEYCLQHIPEIKLLQPTNLKDQEFHSELETLNADVFVVIAFRMLPKSVWNLPPMGTFNIHASLLPQYRGAAPIHWAVINGEKETGVTSFLLNENIDTGNILLQSTTEIKTDETTGELYERLMEMGAQLCLKTLDGLSEDDLIPQPQNEKADLKPAPKIFKQDCEIQWEWDLDYIKNFINGMSPFPAAFTEIKVGEKTNRIRFFKASIVPLGNMDNIENLHQRLFIHKKGEIYLEIKELQPEGKKRMTAKEWINGYGKENWQLEMAGLSTK